MQILPTIPLDYPDPDVIRVDDTYYLVSTTMHFMPGCEILESKDLLSWQHAAYVYDALDSTPGQKLEGGGVYGKGMWAATIRYHEGMFYVLFVCNDTHKTYLYRSPSIEGPWKKSNVDGFYHDASLLFDGDRVFIVYGNRHIYLTELDKDLTGPLPGGVNKEIVTDSDAAILGYEGSHFYKINGRYYIFFIHSRPDMWKRVEACYISDKVEGPYVGGDIFEDDLGYFNSGIAQGGIVDSKEGDYYAVLFQDRGAAGRMPYVLPVCMSGDKPVIMAHKYTPAMDILTGSFEEEGSDEEVGLLPGLYGDDDFSDIVSTLCYADNRVVTDAEHDCFGLKSFWQFNHEPKLELVKAGVVRSADTNKEACYGLEITTDRIVNEPVNAINMLTQRLPGVKGAACVTLDASGLNVGDVMGMCALQYNYLFGGIRRTGDGLEIFTEEKAFIDREHDEIRECASVKLNSSRVRIRLAYDFEDMNDTVQFLYEEGNAFVPLGHPVKMSFSLKHFTGVRAGLCVYSTKREGGCGRFENFTNEIE